MLYFMHVSGGPPTMCRWRCNSSSNFGLIGCMVSEILQFSDFGDLAWKSIFMPFCVGFWGTFPQNNATHHPNPKRTVLGLNHVICAMKREYRPRGSSWALEEKKDRTGQDRIKVTKELYFTYLGKSPHWSDFHQKLCSRWWSWRNLVCQVSKWDFQGLPFNRGSNFLFSDWFLNGPYNSAALLRCLW